MSEFIHSTTQTHNGKKSFCTEIVRINDSHQLFDPFSARFSRPRRSTLIHSQKSQSFYQRWGSAWATLGKRLGSTWAMLGQRLVIAPSGLRHCSGSAPAVLGQQLVIAPAGLCYCSVIVPSLLRQCSGSAPAVLRQCSGSQCSGSQCSGSQCSGSQRSGSWQCSGSALAEFLFLQCQF